MGKAKTLLAVLQGVIIGASGIIPGASGGILAVAFGIYHKALDAIANLLRDFKRSFMFLLPYGIGVLIGVLAAARLLEWLLARYNMPLMYALIGLVLGGIPALVREAGKPLKGKYLLCVLAGAALVGAFALLERSATGGGHLPLNNLTAMLSGGIISIGVVVPGISTSFLLMYMGLYAPLLSAFNRLDIVTLCFAGLGGLIVALLTIKLVRRMFARHPAGCSYTILGFLLGTIGLIFPGVAPLPELLLYMLLLAAGFLASMLLGRLQ